MTRVVAETERLLLKEFDLSYLDAMAKLFDDPEVMRFSTGRRTKEYARTWILRSIEDYEPGRWGFGHYAVLTKNGGEFAGFCGLTRFDDVDGQPEVEIGYRFLKEFWGRGYATEAACAVRDLAFGEHGLTRVISLIEEANVRSVRVAEKVGMTIEKEIVKWDRPVRVYVLTKAGAGKLVVRPYRASDEAGVLDLWRRVFPVGAPHNEPEKELRRKLAEGAETLFVAELNGEVAGTAMLGYDGHRSWVYMVGVRPEIQKRGIGRALMRRIEEVARAKGAPKVNLQVRTENHAVRAFYEKLGYRVEDRISMGKRLYES